MDKTQNYEFPYFAYGSNLSLAQMQARCPGSKHIMRAVLHGYRLVFVWKAKRWGGCGVASIQPDPDHQVPGLLYSMTHGDVEILNGFEGFPTIYQHHHVRVTRADGAECAALTYRNADDSPNPPAKGYFDTIWRGYRHFGLGEQTLFNAVRTANATA